MSASSGFERVSNLIESMKPWMVDLQRSFCRAAAVGPDNDGPGEAKKAREVHKAVIRLAPDEVTDISAPDDKRGTLRPRSHHDRERCEDRREEYGSIRRT